ncbi:MAG: hypothetical protein HYT94_02155 [Parcubacteria group bacterium]|nr:hypothetical protein [Parcubacteria group bacterium]
MKTSELLKKRPKAGRPVDTKTLKGGCYYFTVKVLFGDTLHIQGPFIIQGKPFFDPRPDFKEFLLVRVTGGGFEKILSKIGVFLSGIGVIPYQWDDDMTRVFKFSSKVWNFYKDLVDRQDVEAYKEAIKATL